MLNFSNSMPKGSISLSYSHTPCAFLESYQSQLLGILASYLRIKALLFMSRAIRDYEYAITSQKQDS